MQSIYDEPRQV